MSVDLETLKLELIGAYQMGGSLTRDLVDDIISALERAERVEAALRQIASCEPNAPGDVVHVARAALIAAPSEARE